MASEGASGEHPPPVQTLAAAVLGSVDTVRPPERCPGTPENGRGSRPSCGQRVRWVVEGGGWGGAEMRIEPTLGRGATAVVSVEKHGGS